jgi:hypothetical protein
MCSIILPWMLAWFMAEAAGRRSGVWWTETSSHREPLILLLAICAVVWLVTYTTASIAGLFIALLVDRALVNDREERGRSGNAESSRRSRS